MFSTVTEFLHQNPQLETKNSTKLTTEHLTKLEKEIDGYFPNLNEAELAYLRNPLNSNMMQRVMCTLRRICAIFGF